MQMIRKPADILTVSRRLDTVNRIYIKTHRVLYRNKIPRVTRRALKIYVSLLIWGERNSVNTLRDPHAIIFRKIRRRRWRPTSVRMPRGSVSYFYLHLNVNVPWETSTSAAALAVLPFYTHNARIEILNSLRVRASTCLKSTLTFMALEPLPTITADEQTRERVGANKTGNKISK